MMPYGLPCGKGGAVHKKILIVFGLIASVFAAAVMQGNAPKKTTEQVHHEPYREISGSIRKGETLFDVFKRYQLSIEDLFRIREASASVHRLREVCPDQPYTITVDDRDRITNFEYWIDDDSILCITRNEAGFIAEKKPITYEKRLLYFGGAIQDNLIASMEDSRDALMLALQLSDIFAWDIDFTTDLRNGDTYRIVAEGLYLDGEFKKYGDILSAEFVNDGTISTAYRFTVGGETDYFDRDGKSLKRAFLKAPLSFRRISSGFSRSRYHPVLKIRRPHHGIDYSAAAGTPVSAIGAATVIFSGRKGEYGNLVILRHANGYLTYYGHLSRISKEVRAGRKVEQGQVIGYVGSTGLATGPHLHYEMRIGNRPVNPQQVSLPRGTAVPANLLEAFQQQVRAMDTQLAAIVPATYAKADTKGGTGIDP